MLQRIVDGRTDLVFDYLEAGHAACSMDQRGRLFGSETSTQLLLDTGAAREAKDMNGGSLLTWASWHLRAGVHPAKIVLR